MTLFLNLFFVYLFKTTLCEKINLFNEELYVEKDYNITFNNITFNEKYIFLTHEDKFSPNGLSITHFENNTEVLNDKIHEDNYILNIPHILNKYNLHNHKFKILISNTKAPFSNTLLSIKKQLIYSNFFKIKTNMNISHINTLYVNTNQNVSIYGFNSYICNLNYNNDKVQIVNSSSNIITLNTNMFDYNNIKEYDLFLKCIEHNTKIQRISNIFKIPYIEIDNLNRSYSYIDELNITYSKYNFNDTIIAYISYNNKNYKLLLKDNIVSLDFRYIEQETQINLYLKSKNYNIYHNSSFLYIPKTTSTSTSQTKTSTSRTDTSTTTSQTKTSTSRTDTSTHTSSTDTSTHTSSTDTSTHTSSTDTSTSRSATISNTDTSTTSSSTTTSRTDTSTSTSSTDTSTSRSATISNTDTSTTSSSTNTEIDTNNYISMPKKTDISSYTKTHISTHTPRPTHTSKPAHTPRSAHTPTLTYTSTLTQNESIQILKLFDLTNNSNNTNITHDDKNKNELNSFYFLLLVIFILLFCIICIYNLINNDKKKENKIVPFKKNKENKENKDNKDNNLNFYDNSKTFTTNFEVKNEPIYDEAPQLELRTHVNTTYDSANNKNNENRILKNNTYGFPSNNDTNTNTDTDSLKNRDSLSIDSFEYENFKK